MDFEKAKKHFDEVRKQYQELEGTPGSQYDSGFAADFRPIGETVQLWGENPRII